ncbi:uncharacterized protein K444DRAFT_619767 [Hyaloscypha bicolor E]|uniref:Heterokaryon incompatibility domain-containing protein n=1 Tax=Hyaloscypha bicolor E TaxID=1095630 RepID=A0A2J6SQP5_9HELO|nr:uncharacterized protein K444DRAFT_619767 [Hyaloscypha bicolor E]PMD53098.1 hypothetical protein K444DRAFT_619767 [Hyaloscypha bicolor E]
MLRDVDVSFEKLHGNGATMMKRMLDIQECMAPGERSEAWARNLRLLHVPSTNTSSTGTSPPPRIRLGGMGEHPDETNYLSISYCWPTGTDEDLLRKNGGFDIETPNGLRRSRAPDYVLSVAMDYARVHDIPFVWIDQECIEQQQLDDKEQGINSMDIVYRRGRRTLGILTAELTTQPLVDALAALNANEMPTRREAETELMHAGYDLFCILDKQRWFKRAWVFQERWLSGENLHVVTRVSSNIARPASLGQTTGYAEFQLNRLAYGFCHIHSKSWRNSWSGARDPWHGKFESWSDLKHAMRHIADMRFTEFDGVDLKDPMGGQWTYTSKMLAELELRENDLVHDRLAIFANVLGFQKRLDTRKLISDEYGFSTCAVVLCLLNGELPLFGVDMFMMTLRKFLQDCQPLCGLGVVDHELLSTFRFRSGTLTETGLQVDGWLWHIDREIELTDLQEKYVNIIPKSLWSRDTRGHRTIEDCSFTPPGLWPVPAAMFLRDLQKALKKHGLHRLADATARHLPQDEVELGSATTGDETKSHNDANTKPEDVVRSLWRHEAASCVPGLCKSHLDLTVKMLLYHVIQFGRLWLGHLDNDPATGENNKESDALGLFTCYGPTKALTACSLGVDESEVELRWQNYVSIEVEEDDVQLEDRGKKPLLPLGWESWINGIWYPAGAPMEQHCISLFMEGEKWVHNRISPTRPGLGYPRASHPPETVDISW